MMNVGRWDDARESLDKARKPSQADYIHYAPRLDCLPRSRFRDENLKVAIELRPEIVITREMMRFAFLQETRVYGTALSRKAARRLIRSRPISRIMRGSRSSAYLY